MQDLWSSAATDVNWSNFWNSLSGTTTTSYWWHMGGFQDLWFPWSFDFGSKEEVAPTDKSIHGRVGGKLRPPKLQMPKGYGKRVKTQRHEYSGPHYK